MSIVTEISRATESRGFLITRSEVLGAFTIVGLLTFILWKHFLPQMPPIEQYVPAVESKFVKNVPQETIQPKALKVYTKVAKKKLNLPPEVQADDKKHVVAATTVSRDTRPRTVITYTDSETGDVQTLTRREPSPLLAARKSGTFGIYYGYKSGGPSQVIDQNDWMGKAYTASQVAPLGATKVWRASLTQDLVQTKAVLWGGMLNLDSDGEKFGGVGLRIDW